MTQSLAFPKNGSGSLAGQLLVATPVIQESCFARSVIYMCAHNETGAMGVMVNYPVETIGIKDILEQLEIEGAAALRSLPVHFGGPVESNRGFVLHTDEYASDESMISKGGVALTASIAVLQALAEGNGPDKGMLLLGYAGWSPGQLEAEIESGSWIVVPASRQIIFATDNDTKWNVAASSLGFDMGHFSTVVGHA